MRGGRKGFAAILLTVLLGFTAGCWQLCREARAHPTRSIIASDTILSGMITALLPSERYSVESVLPPGQCPGHYDVKLSDIRKIEKADLTVSFRGMPFMSKAGLGGKEQLPLDSGDRNWMAPESYLFGLAVLAEALAHTFPEDEEEIVRRKEEAITEVQAAADVLLAKIKESGFLGSAVIASSMQKETLEWMGFRVVGEYGRPESMSAREVVELSNRGRDELAVAVVDNLQSGPDAGRGIAETLGVPHVVLTNFPSEKGYLATLTDNVDAVLSAIAGK